jgi:hypothetical protein
MGRAADPRDEGGDEMNEIDMFTVVGAFFAAFSTIGVILKIKSHNGGHGRKAKNFINDAESRTRTETSSP